MAAIYTDSRDVFDNLSVKFSTLLYGRSEGDRKLVNKTLDELNSLDYRHPLVTSSKKAVLLLHQCCTIIPPDDSFLVAKCSQLISNLVSRQDVLVEGRTLQICIHWMLEALKRTFNEVTLDILVALENLVHSNASSMYTLLSDIVTQNGMLLSYANKTPISTQTLLAVQCLESCVKPPSNDFQGSTESNVVQFQICFKVFLKYLMCEKDATVDDLLYCKLQSSCLRGLQNILTQNKDILNQELGLLLGICRSYMVYNIRGVDFSLPQKLMPSLLSIPEAPQSQKKGGKIGRQRKQRTPALKKTESGGKPGKDAHRKTDNEEGENRSGPNHRFNLYTPVSATFALDNCNIPLNNDRLKASDSDFSDSESGLAARIGINEARLRQYALQLLLTIVKNVDKPIMFGYWTSFLPVDFNSAPHNMLTVCILKDPSPHGRSAALVVLLALLTRAKLYLAQAELSEKDRTSFTTFSVTLGMMLKHIHHCLFLALTENSFLVLIQVLKCLAALLQATPYHRLTPGLTSRVVRNVKPLIKHRDTTVQVAALIVLGCVIASEPTVPETLKALLKDIETSSMTQTGLEENSSDSNLKMKTKDEAAVEAGDIEYANFSSSDEEESLEETHKSPERKISWLLKRCLQNLGVPMENEAHSTDFALVPLPVKEESLQVLSAVNRHYFSALLAPHLGYVTEALERCLADKNVALQKHAGRAVDFTGQALQVYLSSKTAESREELVDVCNGGIQGKQQPVTVEQGLVFWQGLLEGPLMQLLHNEEDATARTIGCDCLSNVGPHIFERLSRDKQILCITSLFNCSRDEENMVRGAAVRALAIYVLYPFLREDIGFVMDTAEAICRTIVDKILAVRVKASWSLGNLSDALVLNRNDPSAETIPNSLLLKLLRTCVKMTEDNDKIKSNAVRALGSLMYLVTEDMLSQADFKAVAESGLEALIKCCTSGTNMKVRWNSCYGVGNALRNHTLYNHMGYMLHAVFSALSQLIIDFSNFKVRINAALALSMPAHRQFYGDSYYSVWKSLLLALDNSQNMDDFSEYKHRDHLVDQICLTISHFVTLLELKELSQVEELLQLHLDSLQTHMWKVQDRLLPEQSALLLNANSHIITLQQQLLTHSGQQSVNEHVIQILLKIYNNDLSM